jgi:ATP-dependent Clp protease protease subunit
MKKTVKFNRNIIDIMMYSDMDVSSRTIYLWDGQSMDENGENILDGSVSKNAIKCIKYLDRISNDPITIILNSNGGNVNDGYAIYDVMRTAKSKIIVEVSGVANSAATIVLLGADKKLCYENVEIMIHDGTSFANGNMRDVENQVEFLKKERNNYYKLLAERTKKSKKFWEQACLCDSYFDAEEALKLGLVDKIIKPKKK